MLRGGVGVSSGWRESNFTIVESLTVLRLCMYVDKRMCMSNFLKIRMIIIGNVSRSVGCAYSTYHAILDQRRYGIFMFKPQAAAGCLKRYKYSILSQCKTFVCMFPMQTTSAAACATHQSARCRRSLACHAPPRVLPPPVAFMHSAASVTCLRAATSVARKPRTGRAVPLALHCPCGLTTIFTIENSIVFHLTVLGSSFVKRLSLGPYFSRCS